MGSAHSAKKSSDSSGRVKLTISNAFRSQMQCSPPPQDAASSVLIEESFMTAKLANIYERNSELELFRNSNIVYYNQLMADEQAWRGQEGRRERQKGEISIQDIPEDDHAQHQEGEANIKSKFRERKWIGDYAVTIKTFNESEMRSNELNSEAESIVLEKGYSQFSPQAIMPVNRGSIKETGESERGKRGYGSVGEEYSAFSVSHDNRFKKTASPPIEEDLYDSDHNCERE
jgi:hypothetical protein